MNNSYIVPLLVSVSTLITMLLFFITLFVLVNKTKHRKLHTEKKEMEHRFELALLNSRIETQEQSLNMVSQEIHDGIVQMLGFVSRNLRVLSSGPNTDNIGLVKESSELLDSSINDLRNISHILNPYYVKDIGLEEAIRKELYLLQSSYNIIVRSYFDGEVKEMPKEKELVIFRIAQQALGNIVKHAEATEVTLNIEYADNYFLMSIADNGKGFDQKNMKKANGIGLINMQERTKLINGIFEIDSAPGAGTKVSLKLNTPI